MGCLCGAKDQSVDVLDHYSVDPKWAVRNDSYKWLYFFFLRKCFAVNFLSSLFFEKVVDTILASKSYWCAYTKQQGTGVFSPKKACLIKLRMLAKPQLGTHPIYFII